MLYACFTLQVLYIYTIETNKYLKLEIMKTLETRKQELTNEAKRLFANGGTFETVYEGLKVYREKNGLSHDINLDAIQYLANPNRV